MLMNYILKDSIISIQDIHKDKSIFSNVAADRIRFATVMLQLKYNHFPPNLATGT